MDQNQIGKTKHEAMAYGGMESGIPLAMGCKANPESQRLDCNIGTEKIYAPWLGARGIGIVGRVVKVVVETSEDGLRAHSQHQQLQGVSIYPPWLAVGVDGTTIVGDLRAHMK